jgi:maltose alpha-D-glucosyltransferase/alpha-amylase
VDQTQLLFLFDDMVSSWFKNAIFYSLDVETYQDSNNDGVGDFQGLISRLDYIAGLGVTCIWLLPFYPSPNRDNGYDVTDYYNVDQRLGTLGDFARFMDKCKEYGIRVIIDLVINHTSIEHPWFRMAREDKNSPYRDFYVWSDKPKAFTEQHLMLTGEEDTIWTYDDQARQYYLHRFYKEQPDLNIACPQLRDEILKIIGFWLRLGVSGFRIDAAEHLIDTYGLSGTDKKNLEHFLTEIRKYTAALNPEAILVAETNLPPEKLGVYIANGDRMHMLFNFYVNQNLFLALAKKEATPLVKSLRRLPKLDEKHQWLNFLRHHDELSLKLLGNKEREKVFKEFAPGKNMRLYEHGIRRRLSPMLKGNQKLLELAYSLLYSLPGAPLLRYGDEIGMGDDLSLNGRTSVRTPMQWTPSKNGGFSNAKTEKLVYPIIDKGKFSYENVNIIESQREQSSFLNWIERIITARKQTPEIGLGKLSLINSKSRALLIHSLTSERVKMIFIHNFSSKKIIVSRKSLRLASHPLFDIFCSHPLKEKAGRLIIDGYAYQWIRVELQNKF